MFGPLGFWQVAFVLPGGLGEQHPRQPAFRGWAAQWYFIVLVIGVLF